MASSDDDDPFKTLALLNTLSAATSTEDEEEEASDDASTVTSAPQSTAPAPSFQGEEEQEDEEEEVFVYVPPALIPKVCPKWNKTECGGRGSCSKSLPEEECMTIHPSCVVLCKCESGFFNGPRVACEVTEAERNSAVKYNQIASTFVELNVHYIFLLPKKTSQLFRIEVIILIKNEDESLLLCLTLYLFPKTCLVIF